jgi:Tol biopolymer transport system component
MKAWRAIVIILALAGLVPTANPAGAVLSGENGRIVFASGRDGGDAVAKIYFLPVPSSTGGGTVSAPISVPAGGQFRHPTWSPDRTRIAYANGTPGSPTTENFDIFIQDLVTNQLTPITNTGDSLSADRPAWSPDGTRIAYEHQPTDNSAERDIRVQTVGTSAAPLDLTTGFPFEGRPAWSPDSQTIYYGRTNTFGDLDVVKEPATGGTMVNVQAASGIDEFQPAISPDGSAMCFTLQSPPGNTSGADVFTTQFSNPGFINDLSDNSGSADYNCTWSPDGTLIAYVQGAFSTGALMMERADDTSPSAIQLTDSPGNFDGNPEWAPDGRPTCPDSTVTTTEDTPITIEMECTDTGPTYEKTPVKESIANGGSPTNGTVGQVTLGDPSKVTYTPNAGFTGTDSLNFIGFDDFGFGTDQGTVTIKVNAGGGGGGGTLCRGLTATILGTAGNETLIGTSDDDVIVGLGGKDKIRLGAGDDTACGGPGKDTISGGGGRDILRGQAGKDTCKGGPGKDRIKGCEGSSTA